MSKNLLSTILLILSGILAATPFANAQNLTDEQKNRLLKRFPQLDRDGNGELSPEEIAPIRERLQNSRQMAKQKPNQAAQKGPAPTHANLQYGDHENTIMDVWLADSKSPTPVVVAIHGGGFRGGDKSKYHGSTELSTCLANGVSFVSINYRFRNQDPRGIRACLYDCARAIQFIRHQADKWNIDKERLAAYGGSAGAGTTLWLSCHDDLADPTNEDPVLRESTRLSVGGLNATQATYDVLQWRDFIPSEVTISEEMMKTRADLPSAYGLKNAAELETKEGKAIRKELDMLAWMSADDPPIWMNNPTRGGPVALADQGHINHHPEHVARIKKQADKVGMKTVAIAQAIGLKPDPDIKMIDFFFKHLGVK